MYRFPGAVVSYMVSLSLVLSPVEVNHQPNGGGEVIVSYTCLTIRPN